MLLSRPVAVITSLNKEDDIVDDIVELCTLFLHGLDVVRSTPRMPRHLPRGHRKRSTEEEIHID